MLRIQFYPLGDAGAVLEYLEGLRLDPQKTSAYSKLIADLGFLESEGLMSKSISVERVHGVPGSAWELRRSFDGIKYRIYFIVRRGEAWLLHFLEKKSPKIPKHDLGVFRRRAKEVLSR